MSKQDRIFFNNKEFSSWSSARDQANQKIATAVAGSAWDRLSILPELDDGEDANVPFKLVCKNCGKNCQLRNPAKWHREHKACDAGRGAKYSRASSSLAPEDAQLSDPKRTQSKLRSFMMTPDQIFQWCTLFVKGMVTACVPFTFVMNTHIQSALGMLGIKLNRKDVAGPLLDAICEEQKDWDRSMVADLDYPFGASDGWRKKTCLQGAGLMNFTVCGNQGKISNTSPALNFEGIGLDIYHLLT
jgi:hypothetical protein